MSDRVIMHVLPTVARHGGGPSVSVRRLAEALPEAAPAFAQQVLAGDAAAGAEALTDWNTVQPLLLPGRGPGRVGWTPGLGRAVTRAAPSLIHVHGLWRHHAWAAFQAAHRLGVPLVISPRGMLEPWALRQGRLQKWFASQLFQNRMLARAACVVATSRQEAHGIRAAGFPSVRLAVIPNGVDAPAAAPLAFAEVSPEPGRRTALFLSRIHPKKGILDLLAAWKALAPAGWRLRIVGPDDGGHAAEVAHAIHAHGLGADVVLEGPLWGEARARAYASAEFFVLPTHSENFGMVVAEALAAGLPVLTTRAAPWRELVDERCGWWIEPGRAALEPALGVALRTPRAELAAMGRRGRALVTRRYTWPAVARDMAELYRWLLGGAAGPPAHLLFP